MGQGYDVAGNFRSLREIEGSNEDVDLVLGEITKHGLAVALAFAEIREGNPVVAAPLGEQLALFERFGGVPVGDLVVLAEVGVEVQTGHTVRVVEGLVGFADVEFGLPRLARPWHAKQHQFCANSPAS